METELTTLDSAPTDKILVALTPQEVPAAQTQLIAWCKAKVHALTEERSDFLDTARIALDKGLKYTSFEAAAKRTEKRITYYEKMRAAVEAGYLIVPNFEVEVMAVRVERPSPIRSETTNRAEAFAARPDLLPVGEGRYVDGETTVHSRTRETGGKNYDGSPATERDFWPVGFNETPDFPVLAIKPIVLEATTLAMSRKIFDRIGVVTGRKADPIVVGQLIDPRQRGSQWQQPKVVSFFIAWWLDTRSL